MSSSPRVTIITPTYNRAGLLEETMRSVLSSGYPNLQYVLVDDASTDNTEEVVRKLIDEYPGVITYLRNVENAKESGSINRGWAAAEGKYVSTLSDDDILLPNWFETSVAAMEANPQAIVGYGDWHMISQQGEIMRTTFMPEYSFSSLFGSCYAAPGVGSIIRTDALKGIEKLRPTEYYYLPDYAMWLELATRGDFIHIPKVTALWRCHDTSITISAQSLRKMPELFRVMDDFIGRHAHSPMVVKNAKRLRVRTFLQAARLFWIDGQRKQALLQVLKTFTFSPLWSCVLVGCYLRRIVAANIRKIKGDR